jgi:hypothetical protein
MSFFKKILIAVLFTCFIAGSFTLGQQAPVIIKTATKNQARKKADGSPRPAATPTPSPSPTPTPAETGPEMVKVTLFSSRSPVTRDASYGVFADLENVSLQAITLRASETKLVVQPEVSQRYKCFDEQSATFPALPIQPNAQTDKSGSSNEKSAELELQPQEHYKVFWDLTAEKPPKGNCKFRDTIQNYFGFVPGDYVFTVVGLIHTPQTKDHPSVIHTYSQATTLRVGLSQLSTAWAAFIGALFAYIVVSLQPGRDFDRWKSDYPRGHKVKIFLVILRNALGAGLMGAAVTIVASRLSETQFPIKVSVNDFWGALTIGFFAFFVGARFILAITSKLPPSTTPGTEPVVGNSPGSAPQSGGQSQAEIRPNAAEASTSNLAVDQAVQPVRRTVSFAGEDFDLPARTE